MGCYRHPGSKKFHFVGKSILCGEPGSDVGGICGVYIGAKKTKRHQVIQTMTPPKDPREDPLTYVDGEAVSFECAHCGEHYPNHSVKEFEKVGDTYIVACLECSQLNYFRN